MALSLASIPNLETQPSAYTGADILTSLSLNSTLAGCISTAKSLRWTTNTLTGIKISFHRCSIPFQGGQDKKKVILLGFLDLDAHDKLIWVEKTGMGPGHLQNTRKSKSLLTVAI